MKPDQTQSKVAKPRRGRPSKAMGPVEAQSIVDTGLAMSRAVELADISIVRVAREMGVTPASIHYHMKARENLTLAITDKWFAGLLENWPPMQVDWRQHLTQIAHVIYAHCLAYPGIAGFLATQNRFRLALSISDSGDAPHMLQFLDRLFEAVLHSNLRGKDAAMFAFALSQFVHTAAHATTTHQIPGEQSRFRDLLRKTDPHAFPAIAALRDHYIGLSGEEAFERGLSDLVDSYSKRESQSAL